MDHAGSELEWKLLFYPLLKSSTKSFLFPSVACSSYFWLLCSVFKVRPESFRTHRGPLLKTSISLEGGDLGKGTQLVGTRGVARRKRSFPAGGIHSRRGSSISLGGPHRCSHRNGVVGPSGLEPPTSRLSVVRSSQLSYGPIWWR